MLAAYKNGIPPSVYLKEDADMIDIIQFLDNAINKRQSDLQK